MSAPKARMTYGEREVDSRLTEVLAAVGTDTNDDLIRSMLVTALDMDAADVDRLELKIASQTLAEMLDSWRVFAPYGAEAKVSIFGSARTKPEHPDYQLASELGRLMTERNWMTITGAGPGIMEAGIEGAGKKNSFGVNILLPFEQDANPAIDGDEKLATFKYFFTRKLTFMKETDGYALLPGGFGTMDEAFELLTLIQTGKSYPAPVVLLDHPGSTYWSGWKSFVETELLGGGTIGPDDLDLFHHTHSAAEAADFLCDFYICYHSIRYVGNRLIVRLRREVPEEQLKILNDEFGDILVSGQIEAVGATKAEIRDNDHPDLPRLALRFNNHSFSRLVVFIRRINELGGDKTSAAIPGFIHDVGPDPHDFEPDSES